MTRNLGSNPYSAGGGGTVLEHRYGAVLLSHLLTRAPVPALGDHITPRWIRFQARSVSEVDDILVHGTAPSGSAHYLAIGVRRRPKLVPSEPESVQLIGSYLSVIANKWPQMSSGRWSLALAVVPSSVPANQLKKLAAMAAVVDSPKAFRLKVDEEVDVRGKVHGRLEQLDRLVATAVKAGAPHNCVTTPELTWRLLHRLSLIELRLEEADFSDRTHAVERLQRVTPTGDPSDASGLFGRLAELVGTYAPSGAIVTPEILRKDLSGLPFLHFPDLSAETLEVRSTPATQERETVAARRRTLGRSVPGQPTEKWKIRTASTAAKQPLLCDDTVVVRDGLWLFALDAGTGDRLWSRKTLYDDMPVLGAGATYFAGPLNRALAVDLRSGKKRLPLPVPLHNGFAAFDKGTLYTSGPEGALHAIDPVSRKFLWPKPITGPMVAAPTVREGVVFVLVNESSRPHSPASIANSVLAVDAETGELRWRLPRRCRRASCGRLATMPRTSCKTLNRPVTV